MVTKSMAKVHIVFTIFFVLNFIEYSDSKELNLDQAMEFPISRENFYDFHSFRVHKVNRTSYALNMNVTLFTDFSTDIPLEVNFYARDNQGHMYFQYPHHINKMSVCDVLKKFSNMDFIKLLQNNSNIPRIEKEDDCPTIQVINCLHNLFSNQKKNELNQTY